MNHLDATMSRLTEAETLQGASSPTSADEIGPRLASLKRDLDEGVRRLKALTADNPRQQERLRRLDTVVDLRLQAAAAPEAAPAASAPLSASEMAGGERVGRELDAARKLVLEMNAEERRLLQERIDAATLASWA